MPATSFFCIRQPPRARQPISPPHAQPGITWSYPVVLTRLAPQPQHLAPPRASKPRLSPTGSQLHRVDSMTHNHCTISILSPTSCISSSRRLQKAVLHPAVTRWCKHGAVTVLFSSGWLLLPPRRPTLLVGLLAFTPLSHLPSQTH